MRSARVALVCMLLATIPRASSAADLTPPSAAPAGWISARTLPTWPQPPRTDGDRATGARELARYVIEWLTEPRERGGSGMAAVDAAVPTHATAAGDLDGDGLEDVIIAEGWVGDGGDGSTRISGGTLTARRGHTGQPIWRREMAGGAILPFSGDVITFELMDVRPGPVDGDPHEYTWRLERIRGADGTSLWTNTLTSSAIFEPTRTWEGIPRSLRSIPDATGDGRDDLLLDTVDDVETLAYGSDALLVTGHLLDGVTGAEAGTTTATGIDIDTPFATRFPAFEHLPMIVPTSDLNGDGLGDVITINGNEGQQVVLAAQQATGGAPFWTTPVLDVALNGVIEPIPARLDDDEIPDFIIQVTRSISGLTDDAFSVTYYGETLFAIDGATGQRRWSGSVKRGGFLIGGDLDADGFTDARVYQFVGPSTLRLTGIAGPTGNRVYGPYDYAPGGDADVYICLCSDDLTADGAHETLAAAIVYGPGPDYPILRSPAVAFDGRSGAVLWDQDVPALDGLPLPVGSDVDGDGARDLYALAASSSGEDSSITLTMRKGSTFEQLWARSGPIMAADAYGVWGSPANLTDGEAPEVVATIVPVDITVEGPVTYITPGPPFATAIGGSGILWSFP